MYMYMYMYVYLTSSSFFIFPLMRIYIGVYVKSSLFG